MVVLLACDRWFREVAFIVGDTSVRVIVTHVKTNTDDVKNTEVMGIMLDVERDVEGRSVRLEGSNLEKERGLGGAKDFNLLGPTQRSRSRT